MRRHRSGALRFYLSPLIGKEVPEPGRVAHATGESARTRLQQSFW